MRDPDRAMIDAALAAGKLRRIPAGVCQGHPDWGRYATTDPLRTHMGKRLYMLLYHAPNKTFSVREAVTAMSRRGIIATGASNVDRYERVRMSFVALEAAGIVEQLPLPKSGTPTLRWKLKDGSTKPATQHELQEESRRLRGDWPRKAGEQR